MKTGLLSHKQAVLQRNPGIRESAVIASPVQAVSVQGYFYLVDFGLGNYPRFHRVNKAKECSCGAPYCEAIEAVRLYLQSGGLRAPDPEGMPPCSICGSKTYRDRVWDGKYTKTLGWICSKGGLHHFLVAKAERIKKQQVENPWLIPSAPGYPGVLREDVGKVPDYQNIILEPVAK
jgi:hypothetical protein